MDDSFHDRSIDHGRLTHFIPPHAQYCENPGEYPYHDPHSIHRIQNWIYCYMVRGLLYFDSVGTLRLLIV